MAFSGSGLLLAYFHGIASWLVLAGGWSWYPVVPDGTDLSILPAWRGDLHPRPFLC